MLKSSLGDGNPSSPRSRVGAGSPRSIQRGSEWVKSWAKILEGKNPNRFARAHQRLLTSLSFSYRYCFTAEDIKTIATLSHQLLVVDPSGAFYLNW